MIATSTLPSRSAERGRDKDVEEQTRIIFGNHDSQNLAAQKNTNAAGGKAYFIPKVTPTLLRNAIDDAGPVRDVIIELEDENQDGEGMLSYRHVTKAGRDVYFLANSTDRKVEASIRVRGKKRLQLWNPHTGVISRQVMQNHRLGRECVSSFGVDLPPVTSVLLVSKR